MKLWCVTHIIGMSKHKQLLIVICIMQYVVISIMVCEILWRPFSHATGGSEDPRSGWGWGWGVGCGVWRSGVGCGGSQIDSSQCLQCCRGCHGRGLYHCHGTLLVSASRVAGAVTVEAYMCSHVLVVTDMLNYLCILKMNNNSTGCQ